MKEMLKLVFILIVLVVSNFLAIYFHDKNIVHQCNKYGFTDSLMVGTRLSCLEIN